MKDIVRNAKINPDKTIRRAQFNKNYKIYKDLHDNDGFAEDIFLVMSTLEKQQDEMDHGFKEYLR